METLKLSLKYWSKQINGNIILKCCFVDEKKLQESDLKKNAIGCVGVCVCVRTDARLRGD